MKTKFLYIFLLGLVGFTACEKERKIEKENADTPTLAELADAEEDPNNYLVIGNHIDNTGLYERYVANSQDRAIIFRPFPSGWGWDCVGCFGMCNVDNPFPFPFPGEPVPFPFPWESIDHSSVGGAFDAGPAGMKLQIYPKPSELSCAITGDGEFPIAHDIYMSEETCSIMGLPTGTFIESGIYSANVGEGGEYESVTLNLSH